MRRCTSIARWAVESALLVAMALLGSAAGCGQGCDGAGNCYIRAGATGSGTGASWANAYTGFGTGAGQVDPANMVRGVTYWIAAGAYGGVVFSTPGSGGRITLMGATAASHGPAADWDASYAGEAVFGPSWIKSDGWTFNGQARGADWQSGYSLKFWNQSDPSGAAMALGSYEGGVRDVSFLYVEMEGTGAGFPQNASADRCSTDNCGMWEDKGLFERYPSSNLYVGYSFVHHTGNSQFQMNNVGRDGLVNEKLTWEYNWVSYNHTGQNGLHDEAYALLANDVTIRFNVFQDISGTGLITDASAASPALSNWYVYGNIFFNDADYLALGQVYWLNTMDNGILAFGDGEGSAETLTGTILFANNTIANWSPAGVSCASSVYSTQPVSGVPGMVAGDAKVTIENNLWYGAKCVYGGYTSICSALPCTQDYNTSYAGGIAAEDHWQTLATPAAHDVNVAGAASPLVNSAASTLAGFAPAVPDPFLGNAGVPLGAPFDTDLQGQARGANGTWDRGALQSRPTAQEPVGTRTVLQASPLEAARGSAITLKATVTAVSSDLVATGTVMFSNAGVVLGRVILDGKGEAALATQALPVGRAAIVAAYEGDARCMASSSAPVQIRVLEWTATPTFDPPPGRYAAAQTMALSDATPGAAIFYTTDGSLPSPDGLTVQ